MCGIAGIFNGKTLAHWDALESMTNALTHRGPDSLGLWKDLNDKIALGHRRLSIIDLSSEGQQPMHSQQGRYTLVFNGEIYNFQTLKKQLSDQGVSFRGSSDTEVLLNLIEQEGIHAALTKSVGMFAFALWDKQDKKLFLARDRFGEKPLYYTWINDTLIFASELKALHRFPDWHPHINSDVLSLFMRYSYIPTPYTIYEKTHKLIPGTYLEIQHNGQFKEHLFWSAESSVIQALTRPKNISLEAALTETHDQLVSTLQQQRIADVPVGTFLSGGIDSSLVTALLQSQSTTPINTFSIGYNNEEFNEAGFAKKIATHLKTHHTEWYLSDKDCLEIIPKLSTLYDEPFADSSQIPTYLVSHIAKQQVTVCLSGDGGDELFGGYNRYPLANRFWSLLHWIPASLRTKLLSGVKRYSMTEWNDFYQKILAYLPKKYQVKLFGNKIYKLAELAPYLSTHQTFYYGLISVVKDPQNWILTKADSFIPLSTLPNKNFVQWMMLMDSITYLRDDILTKVDRASMGNSLEVRCPFLDHRLFELAWQLPQTYKIRQGERKWLLKQLLYRYVPKELIDRPKMGFGIPLSQWLNTSLKPWVESLLDENLLKSQGYFNAQQVRQSWQQHLAGEHHWQPSLWNVLMFQSWLSTQ